MKDKRMMCEHCSPPIRFFDSFHQEAHMQEVHKVCNPLGEVTAVIGSAICRYCNPVVQFAEKQDLREHLQVFHKFDVPAYFRSS